MKFADVQPGQKFIFCGEEHIKLKPYAVDSNGTLWEFEGDEEVGAKGGTIATIKVGDKFCHEGRHFIKVSTPDGIANKGEVWAVDDQSNIVIFGEKTLVDLE
jgi:hypothetical protein